jgi:hypothetical protein
MEEAEAIKRLLNAIYMVGSEITSKKYIQMVLKTIIKSIQSEYPFFSEITVGDDHIELGPGFIQADDGQMIKATIELVEVIRKPFKENESPFDKMVSSQLDDETKARLKTIGLYF